MKKYDKYLRNLVSLRSSGNIGAKTNGTPSFSCIKLSICVKVSTCFERPSHWCRNINIFWIFSVDSMVLGLANSPSIWFMQKFVPASSNSFFEDMKTPNFQTKKRSEQLKSSTFLTNISQGKSVPISLASGLSLSDNARPVAIFSEIERDNAVDKSSRNPSLIAMFLRDWQRTVLKFGLSIMNLKTDEITECKLTFFTSAPFKCMQSKQVCKINKLPSNPCSAN